MKSDSLLKPSILVLCDMAKELVTRTGVPMKCSLVIYILCVFLIQLTKITLDRENIDGKCHS